MKKLFLTLITALALSLSLTACSDVSAEGTTWKLKSFGDSKPTNASSTNEVPTFTLDDGSITGHGGVNNFNGTFTRSGHEISISMLASTRMAGPPEAMDQETIFLQALEHASFIEIHGDTMTLSDSRNEVLVLMVADA